MYGGLHCVMGNTRRTTYEQKRAWALSNGYRSRLIIWRFRVRMPAMYFCLTFFTSICCGNCNGCLKKTENKWKWCQGYPIFNIWSENSSKLTTSFSPIRDLQTFCKQNGWKRSCYEFHNYWTPLASIGANSWAAQPDGLTDCSMFGYLQQWKFTQLH